MLAIEVEYLLGRVFAADFRDRSAPEWPPHPARLFSALAAAYFEGGQAADEKEVLEWLESQGPPAIYAPEAGDAAATIAYVPTNYPGALPGVLRGKQPRSFAAQGPAEIRVYFIWKEDVTGPVREALENLASRTAYLGKSCSVARLTVLQQDVPSPNYVPDSTGGEVLRVPRVGRLAELQRLFAADQQCWIASQARYLKLGVGEPSYAQSAFGELIVFRQTGGPVLPLDATLTVTEVVRKALIRNAEEAGAMTELIHGHGGPHCAIIPLPYTGEPHGDGHLLGFAVALPRDSPASERRKVLAACGRLTEVHLPQPLGGWSVEWQDTMPGQQALRHSTWTKPATTWKTVSPILLDRFPKKNGPSVEAIIGSACQRIGLPLPATVDHSPYGPLKGVPAVTQFQLRRAGDPARWGVHATLTFREKVEGPVILGAGRHFGLGLLKPRGSVNDAD